MEASEVIVQFLKPKRDTKLAVEIRDDALGCADPASREGHVRKPAPPG